MTRIVAAIMGWRVFLMIGLLANGLFQLKKHKSITENNGGGYMKFILILVTLLMIGCATGYQKKGISGGYSDAQIDENSYRVTFTGNGYSSKEQVENMLLYRSAELTNEKGYDWFSVNERESNEQSSIQYGRTELESTAIVKMYKGVKPESAFRSYSAKSVIEHLGKSINR